MSKEKIIELAENGVYNSSDYFYECHHFLDQEVDLTPFHLPEFQDSSLEDLIRT